MVALMREPKRVRLERRRSQMEAERASYIAHWRQIGDAFLPQRPRFNFSDNNRGHRLNQQIIRSTGIQALDVFVAGIMGGMTNPAKRWFGLQPPKRWMREVESVKYWLHEVNEVIFDGLARTNFYDDAQSVYEDWGLFGSAATFMEEDFKTVLRFQSQPIGSWMCARDAMGVVNEFARDLRYTVDNLLERFGGENGSDWDGRSEIDWRRFSQQVKSAAANGNLNVPIEVTHIVYPNRDFEDGGYGEHGKRFSSCYYERSSNQGGTGGEKGGEGLFLRESGYDEFPVLTPTWNRTAGDIYGTRCPGMVALGDVKQTYHYAKRLMQAADKELSPPVRIPYKFKNNPMSFQPGGFSYSDDGGAKTEAAYQINFKYDQVLLIQQEAKEDINRAFYGDLFRRFAELRDSKAKITATEVSELAAENIVLISPHLARLNNEYLSPMIGRYFAVGMEHGIFPEPPEEIQGERLKLEYESSMAQAQRSQGWTNDERFLNTVLAVAPIAPGVVHKVNWYNAIDNLAEKAGIQPDMIRSDEDAAELEEQAAQAAAAEAQSKAAKNVTGAVKDLATSPTGTDSALDKIVDAISQQGRVA